MGLTSADSRAVAAQTAAAALAALVAVHRVTVPPAGRPVANPDFYRHPADKFDPEAVRAAHLATDSKDLHFWQRQALAEAKAQADIETSGDAAAYQAACERAEQSAQAAAAAAQVQLDKAWQLLLANDSRTVLATLEHGFVSHACRATAVHCEDGVATVIVVFGRASVVLPSGQPTTTPGGRGTVKTWTQTALNEAYLNVIASEVLLVLKVAMASCPKLAAVRLAVIRPGDSAESCDGLEVVYRAEFRQPADSRGLSAFDRNPVVLLRQAEGAEIEEAKRTGEAQALPLDDAWRSALGTIAGAVHAHLAGG